MSYDGRGYERNPVALTRRPARPVGELRQNGHKTKLKVTPPEQTNAEEFYYLKQMNARTPMVLVLADGEEIRGWIEWYDKSCLKVNRTGAPNIVILKQCIKYLFKDERA